MLRQLHTLTTERVPRFVEAVSPVPPQAPTRCKATNSERLTANRSHSLLEEPIGTVVWRDFTDQQEEIQHCRTEVFDYKTIY